MHREGGGLAEVVDVVDVVAAEGPPLALGQQALVDGALRPRVLGQGALDGEEGPLGLEVVVPAGRRADGPADQPDLEVGAGVEPVPGPLT